MISSSLMSIGRRRVLRKIGNFMRCSQYIQRIN